MAACNYIAISAQDIADQCSISCETDCLSTGCHWRTETDCACPTDDVAPLYAGMLALENVPYSLPALYTAACGDGFYLVFNPMGSAGVVVVNQPAYDLLNSFRQPRTLQAGVAVIRDAENGLKMARRLAALGLLEPAGGHCLPKPISPHTLTAWLHVTNECNLRCPYCYVHKAPDKMPLEQGRHAVEAVFRSAAANGFRCVKLKYAGGEATLNLATALALHDYARQLADRHRLALEAVVLSNGVALSNHMIAELQTRAIQLMISLDGVGRYHDAQRPFVGGRGSFVHVERSLDRLAARGFKPTISITISSRNCDGLPELVDYVLKRELPFTLNFYREHACSAALTDLAFGDDQIVSAMKAAFAVIKANLPPRSLLGALVDRARLDLPHDRPCGVGHTYMAINHKGEVTKCHMEIERAVTDVSAPDPLRLIREDESGILNLPVEEKSGCRTCTWRYWCAGGCPALTYRLTGRYDTQSPNCNIYKALFPEVLRLEGLRLLKYSKVRAS